MMVEKSTNDNFIRYEDVCGKIGLISKSEVNEVIKYSNYSIKRRNNKNEKSQEEILISFKRTNTNKIDIIYNISIDELFIQDPKLAFSVLKNGYHQIFSLVSNLDTTLKSNLT